MSDNDPFEMPDDETLSPELAAFESQLRSLKPHVAQPTLRRSRCAAAEEACDRPTLRRTLIGGLIIAAALSLLMALTLFGPGRVNNPDTPPQVIPGNGHQIAEIKTPEPTHLEDQPPANTPTVAFHGGLTMRKQLVMLLDEMQPQGIAAIEPKQPDYPVMVIPVCQNTQPLSPEAKQAFQRRLQRIEVW